MYLLDPSDPSSPLVTSASDLTLASGCEFGFLCVLDERLGRAQLTVPDDDSMLVRAGELGGRHEQRKLEELRALHGDALVELDRPRGDVDSIKAAAEATQQALRDGAPVVYQGVFWDEESDPDFPTVGYADFIMRQPDGAYRIVDTKLARKVKVTALLQLAAYHEQLARLDVAVDDTVELVLGDGRSETAHIDDIAPVFRVRRDRLRELIQEHRAEDGPVRWGDPRYAVDGRCKYCEGPAKEADDLIGVAGMRLTQRAELIAAGITTIAQLADTPARPPAVKSIAEATYRRLHLQAQLQVASEGMPVPQFRVDDPKPIAALPEPSPGDIFFDFEGDPLHEEIGPDGTPRWGLDYLFGWVDADGSYSALWAHEQAEEATALEQFLDLVAERRRQHPDMHIYHYAAYEKTHLLSIAARHGVREHEVDQLLRDGVLVDLYPVVTSALRIGVRSYSIKKLEPLYLDTSRSGVTSAGDSVEEYVRARALKEDGAHEEAREVLDAIASYNADDCRSTLALRDWLRSLPGVEAARAHVELIEQEDGTSFEPNPLAADLTELAETAFAKGVEADGRAYRLAAAALDYHRREHNAFWWRHHLRREQPASEWEDDRDVFTIERVEVHRDWSRQGGEKTPHRELRLWGRWAPGSTPSTGGVFLLYPEPVPYQRRGHRPGQRLGHEAKITAILGEGELLVDETPKGHEPWDAFPTHVAPSDPPRADNITAAIEAWCQTLLDAAPNWPQDAMSDLLRRRPPRTPLAPMRDAEDGVRAVTASLTAMDRGTIAVQGPPGTGKTYLASHVVAGLVRDHRWRIGVTAQSHRVIEKVLGDIVRAGLAPELVAKAPQDGAEHRYADEPFTALRKEGHQQHLAEHAHTGCVIGGTAWDFTNRNRILADQLDLIVIEEAGQFSLANTIGVATSAKRILLLGDPQQLPQVSQGTHPAPVDGSALGHLVGDEHVMPEQYGYFLPESRRMAPDVTTAVSRLAYDGQLHSHPSTAGRSLDGLTPGVHPVPLSHIRCSTESQQEADEAVRIIRTHLDRSWIEAAGTPARPLAQTDFIVVTPYNAQVQCITRTLERAGLEDVPVGTVDKFQGREAVIAIVSLATSDATELPRGLEFLLSRNRLNVSISRAQWAAFLIHSARLLDVLPTTPAGVATLSRFITLVTRES